MGSILGFILCGWASAGAPIGTHTLTSAASGSLVRTSFTGAPIAPVPNPIDSQAAFGSGQRRLVYSKTEWRWLGSAADWLDTSVAGSGAGR
jgi:hypothetical protein